MKYDIVVVGGRVSGSIASLYASKNDMNVLMIEKHQEIGTPVQCAGGVSKSFLDTLEIKLSPDIICSKIKGAKLHSPQGDYFTSTNEILHGYILERKMLDKSLAMKSAEAGTDIMLKTHVKDLIINKGRVEGVIARNQGKLIEIPAQVVIGADGIESQIARIAQLNHGYEPIDLVSCAQYEMVGLDVESSMMEFFFGSKIAPGGYVWIFPKGEQRANVGVGVRNTEKAAIHYLEKFISRFNATKIELNVGAVPVCGPSNKTYGNGILITGDAAGQVDPITGGGIHLASICSKLAGEIAAEAIKNEDLSADYLQQYEQEWQQKISKNLERSFKYRQIFDKLNDQDLNKLIQFFNKNDVESLSTLSLWKLALGFPKLFKSLKNIL